LDVRSISIDDYADCIYHLLQFENLSKVDLLGHSMGGYITLAFAEKYPEMLRAFGLVHSTAFSDSTEKKENRDRSIQLIKEYGPHPFLRNTIPNLFGKQFKQDHPEKVEALIRAAEYFKGESLIQYLTAMKNRPDRTAVLLSNRLPVLFVIGTEDIAAPLEDLLQQINLPQNPHVHIMQQTGHMGMWENTLEMNTILLDFIQRKN
jgi:pimeloyl-ACP methyl ester carboxylesterase